MKLFNPNYLRNKQRFPAAIIAGILSALGCAILYYFITLVLGVQISLLYIAAGYGIAYAIKTFGRGIDNKFSILAIICTLLFVLLAHILVTASMFGFQLSLIAFYLQSFFVQFNNFDVHTIMEIMCIAYSCYIAYYYSKII